MAMNLGAGPVSIDGRGRHVREARIELAVSSPFQLIYHSPELTVSGDDAADALTADETGVLCSALVELGIHDIHLFSPVLGSGNSVVDLVRQIKSTPGVKRLTLTTMATDLADRAGLLKDAGLDEVHVNLDTLRTGRYQKITGTDLLPEAQAGLAASKSVFPGDTKINFVAMRGVNMDEVFEFVALVLDEPLEVRFIELVPFSGAGWMQSAVVPWTELKANILAQYPLVQIQPGEDAESDRCPEIERFRIPDHTGKVGFYHSMSQPTCGLCYRIRFRADGRMQACQFSAPDDKVRKAIRAGAKLESVVEAVRALIEAKVAGRPDEPELVRLADSSKRAPQA